MVRFFLSNNPVSSKYVFIYYPLKYLIPKGWLPETAINDMVCAFRLPIYQC